MEDDASNEVALAPDRARSKGRSIVWVLAGLAFVVFLPSTLCGFVFDDIPLISGNHYAQSLEYLGRAFTTHLWDVHQTTEHADTRRYYRPIVAASYLINWVAGGGRAWLFHLFNVLCHAACVVLAARIARRWTGHAGLGVLAALVFALHPTRTETVTWISGRTDLLMTMFMLLAVECAYLAGRTAGRRALLLAAATLATTVLAIMSKENAVFTGLLIAVDAALSEQRSKRMLVRLAWSTAGLGALYVGVRVIFYPVVLSSEPTEVTIEHGLLTCWAYLERIVFPWPQTFFHRTLIEDASGRPVPIALMILGGCAVLGFLALVVFSWRRDRPALWLLIASVGLMGPLLNFTDSGIGVTTSDRFLYLPLLTLVSALLRLGSASMRKLLDHRTVRLAGAGVVLVWIAVIQVRAFDYVDDDAFWGHEFALDPQNPFVGYNIARLHARRGEVEEALALSKRNLQPEAARYSLLWTPLARAGRYLQALALQSALTADGDAALLEAQFSEMDAFLSVNPGLLKGRVADLALGGQVPKKVFIQIAGPDGFVVAAEGAMLAARIGKDERARSLLGRLVGKQLWLIENPLNLALTYARLGDFARARTLLDSIADPPAGITRFEPEEIEDLRRRLNRAERILKQAENAPLERAAVLRATAMAELGAYLRALRLLRPVYDADPRASGIAPLYVQLLIAARLDREALEQATRLLGSERAAQTVAKIREQLPERTRNLRAPTEPSPWWKR